VNLQTMTNDICPDCGLEIPEDAPLGMCPVCLIDSLDDQLESPDPTGETIGNYHIIRKLGEGGFAIVYEAEQIKPVRRRVALKVLKPDIASPQVLARFDAERQALALMDHPNIAAIYDAGQTEDGDPYFAMELVDGGALTDFCRQQLLTRTERLRILQSVCEAVQHAHLKGVIHRDIKPSNILVTLIDDRPVPKVIDFGIARALDVSLTDRTIFTEFYQIVGTPSYMSPEQAALDGSPIDGRSDIYSLGVLIYETLSGVQPFSSGLSDEKSMLDVLRRVTLTDPPPLSHHDAELRGEVEWVVGKAMAKIPSDRYDSAGSLARELERILENRPVVAAAPSRWYPLKKFVERHRPAVIAGALVAASLLIGIVVSWLQFARATALSHDLQRREIELRQEFRNSDYKLGLQLAARRRPADAIAYFCRALRTDPDHHASASCLLSLLTHQKFNKPTHPAIPYPDTVSSCRLPIVFEDSQQIASIADQNGTEVLVIWNPKAQIAKAHPTGFDGSIRFLIPADLHGRFAISDGATLEIRNIAEPTAAVFLYEFEAHLTAIICAPRWETLAVGFDDGQLVSRNIKTGERQGEIKTAEAPIRALALAREATFLAYGTESGAIGIWGINSGMHQATDVRHRVEITALALSESGSHLISGDASGSVHSWKAQRLEHLAGPIYHGGAVRLLRVNSAYRNFMSGSDDGFARLWTMDGTLSPPVQVFNSPVRFGTLTPSSTEFLAAGDGGGLRVWSANGGSGEALIGAGRSSAVASGPENRLLAVFSNATRSARLFDISREPAHLFRNHPNDDLSEEFPSPSPEVLESSSGEIRVRFQSVFTLRVDGPDGATKLIRVPQSISAWTLRKDGRQLAVLMNSNRLQLWDTQTGEPLTPLLRLSTSPKSLRFAAPENRLEVLLPDGESAVVDIPRIDRRLPDWFLQFVERLGGKRLDEDGVLRNLDDDSLNKAAELIPSEDGSVAWRHARWLVDDVLERTLGPGIEVSVQDYVQQLLETGEPGRIREALRLDPANPTAVQILKSQAAASKP
jgi:serine/threonine protein kinase/WD40 repeat protein